MQNINTQPMATRLDNPNQIESYIERKRKEYLKTETKRAFEKERKIRKYVGLNLFTTNKPFIKR